MLHIREGTNTLELSPYDDGTPARIQWVESEADDADASWGLRETTSGRLELYNHTTDTQTAWVDSDDTLHVQDIAIEGDSSIDAGTLDGLDSAQFLRRDRAATHASDLDVAGTLSQAGNRVLTTADEGDLDAGTLAGRGLDDVRPAIYDDGTTIHAGANAIDFGQRLTVDASDGLTVHSTGGNSVGTEVTQSGDGAQTTFSLSHELGAVPATVDVTPHTEDAAADFWVTGYDEMAVDIEYAAAPPDGTDNLAWGVTAVGDDGTGLHEIQIEDTGEQVERANTLDFGSGLDATTASDGHVTVDAAVDTAVSASDGGTEVLAEAAGFDFGDHLAVSASGDIATVDVTNPAPTVSDDGTERHSAPANLNFGNALSVAVDGDTVSVHGSTDADTLGGHSASQFVRADADDDHTGRLGVTELGAADGSTVAVTDDFAFDTGVGIVNEAGSDTHRVRPRREGLQSLSGGGSLPTDYGVAVEADATVAFVETDNDRVAGWVDTNNESLTMPGGVRVGDAGGPPAGDVALDVRGEARLAVETRTSDPSNPEVGRLWLRTDLLPDT